MYLHHIIIISKTGHIVVLAPMIDSGFLVRLKMTLYTYVCIILMIRYLLHECCQVGFHCSSLVVVVIST